MKLFATGEKLEVALSAARGTTAPSVVTPREGARCIRIAKQFGDDVPRNYQHSLKEFALAVSAIDERIDLLVADAFVVGLATGSLVFSLAVYIVGFEEFNAYRPELTWVLLSDHLKIAWLSDERCWLRVKLIHNGVMTRKHIIFVSSDVATRAMSSIYGDILMYPKLYGHDTSGVEVARDYVLVQTEGVSFGCHYLSEADARYLNSIYTKKKLQ